MWPLFRNIKPRKQFVLCPLVKVLPSCWTVWRNLHSYSVLCYSRQLKCHLKHYIKSTVVFLQSMQNNLQWDIHHLASNNAWFSVMITKFKWDDWMVSSLAHLVTFCDANALSKLFQPKFLPWIESSECVHYYKINVRREDDFFELIIPNYFICISPSPGIPHHL